jgi:hypothetical protein
VLLCEIRRQNKPFFHISWGFLVTVKTAGIIAEGKSKGTEERAADEFVLQKVGMPFLKQRVVREDVAMFSRREELVICSKSKRL